MAASSIVYAHSQAVLLFCLLTSIAMSGSGRCNTVMKYPRLYLCEVILGDHLVSFSKKLVETADVGESGMGRPWR
jgi:hypothetical protein